MVAKGETKVIFIESEKTNPYYNLALEEYAFNILGQKEDCFILWQNENTIVVGKYQNTAEEINSEYVREKDIKVVRRLSGGGAVYHDSGNLNFSFIINKEHNPEFEFSLYVQPVISVLKKYGINAVASGRNDITIDGKKFSGNSQYMKNKRILHHGCIMLDSNIEDVSAALKVNEAKFVSKSIKSVKSRVTTINANVKEKITMQQFKSELKDAVFSLNSVKEYKLTQSDEEAILKLQKEKYETWEWNYGKNPPYNVIREKKFDSGLVTIKMQVEHFKIEEIKIYGDFFGKSDITELEEKLKGLALDETLSEVISAIDIDTYIKGITAKDMIELLL